MKIEAPYKIQLKTVNRTDYTLIIKFEKACILIIVIMYYVVEGTRIFPL